MLQIHRTHAANNNQLNVQNVSAQCDHRMVMTWKSWMFTQNKPYLFKNIANLCAHKSAKGCTFLLLHSFSIPSNFQLDKLF